MAIQIKLLFLLQEQRYKYLLTFFTRSLASETDVRARCAKDLAIVTMTTIRIKEGTIVFFKKNYQPFGDFEFENLAIPVRLQCIVNAR